MTEAEIARLIAAHGLWLLFVLTLIEGPMATLIGAAKAGRGLLDPLAVFGVAFAGDLVGVGVLCGGGHLAPGLTQSQPKRRRAVQVIVTSKATSNRSIIRPT